MTDVALDQILSEAIETCRAATTPEEYEPVRLLLEKAKLFGRQAFDVAVGLLSGDTDEKILGCDLLLALCNPDSDVWGHEAARAIVEMAPEETDDDLCIFIAQALGFTRDSTALPTLIRLADHSKSDVRYQVACAIPSCWSRENSNLPFEGLAVATLMSLMKDDDVDVRDLATFGLARLMEVDSLCIRDAFVERLNDPDAETRLEAICGLARRHDIRALKPLIDVIETGNNHFTVFEAAECLADERLLAVLQNASTVDESDSSWRRRAIAACDPLRQQRAVTIMSIFVDSLTDALSVLARPYTAHLCCDLYETGITLVVSEQKGTEPRWWSFEALLERGQNEIGRAVSFVLSDLEGGPPAAGFVEEGAHLK
jgi:hypothetical protein